MIRFRSITEHPPPRGGDVGPDGAVSNNFSLYRKVLNGKLNEVNGKLPVPEAHIFISPTPKKTVCVYTIIHFARQAKRTDSLICIHASPAYKSSACHSGRRRCSQFHPQVTFVESPDPSGSSRRGTRLIYGEKHRGKSIKNSSGGRRFILRNTT